MFARNFYNTTYTIIGVGLANTIILIIYIMRQVTKKKKAFGFISSKHPEPTH